MSFRLVSKSVTLNDVERRIGRYFALFQRIRVASGAHCVKVHVRYLISWWVLVIKTFGIRKQRYHEAFFACWRVKPCNWPTDGIASRAVIKRLTCWLINGNTALRWSMRWGSSCLTCRKTWVCVVFVEVSSTRRLTSFHSCSWPVQACDSTEAVTSPPAPSSIELDASLTPQHAGCVATSAARTVHSAPASATVAHDDDADHRSDDSWGRHCSR